MIYYRDKKVVVDLTLISCSVEITVYDIIGQLLINKKVEGNRVHEFDLNSRHAVYVVKVNSKEKAITRKVLAN